MIRDINNFKNLESFITHIKCIEGVVGIVEYGGRSQSDVSKGGDYDLTIIFQKSISNNFTGLHFHIGGIPIDCMILSVDDFKEENPKDIFLLVHLNCKILYDKDSITANLLKDIGEKWNKSKRLSDSEINLFRFTFKHIIDKLQHRLHDDEVYSRYFITSSFDWFLQCFARIKNLDIGKSKAHLVYIKENEKDLYEIIKKLYCCNDLDLSYEMLKKAAEYILCPIGGFWREDEVLFHLTEDGINDYKEQERIMKLIF